MVEPSQKAILADYRVRLATTQEDEFLAVHEEFVSWLANLEESSLEELEQQDYLTQHQEFFTACQRRYLAVKERQEVSSLLEKRKTVNLSGCERLMSEFGINTYER